MIHFKRYLRIGKRSIVEKVLTLGQETVSSILVVFTDDLCDCEMLDQGCVVNPEMERVSGSRLTFSFEFPVSPSFFTFKYMCGNQKLECKLHTQQ